NNRQLIRIVDVRKISLADLQSVQTDVAPQSAPTIKGSPPTFIPPVGQVNYLSSHPDMKDGTVEGQIAVLLAYSMVAWNNGYMPGLSDMYCDNVVYYDKATPKAGVLLDKQKFMERWPNRNYKIRLNSISIECHGGNEELGDCTARGIVDWQATNSTKRSTGSASFDYWFQQYPQGTWHRFNNEKLDYRIYLESSEVIQRQITDLAGGGD